MRSIGKIGILSDSHDHLDNLAAAVGFLSRNGCDLLLHLGDFVSSSTLPVLAKPGLRVEAVFGNCDADRAFLAENWIRHLTPLGGRLAGGPRTLEVEGRKILLMHEPATAESAADGGAYDLVLHGHTHDARCDRRGPGGRTLLVNPGEVFGNRRKRRSVAIYDTVAHEARVLDF